MAIRRYTDVDSGICTEEKGYYGHDANGEYGWIAVSGRYPCGTWRTGNDIQEPKVFAAEEAAFGRVPSRTNVFSDSKEREQPVFLTTGNVFDAAEVRDRAQAVQADSLVLDADGREVADNKLNSETPETKKRKTLYWVAAIIILLVVFRKRLGFG